MAQPARDTREAPPAGGRPSPPARLWLAALSALGGALAALAAAAALLPWSAGDRAAALPVIGKAPHYRLVNQNGKPVSSQDFAGKVRIVAPLFPYCRELCPLVAANLAEFDDKVVRGSDLKGHVVFVFLNIAPKAAGPTEMRAFLLQYGWNPEDPAVEFLTGSPAAMRQVVEHGYHIAYYRTQQDAGDEGSGIRIANALADRVKADFDVKHADVIEVVDRRGRIRKIFTDGSRVGDMALQAAVAPLVAGRRG